MPKAGYSNLSIETKRYDDTRKSFDTIVKPQYSKITFSDWAMTTIESGITREELLKSVFPKMHYVGKRQNGGIVIDDNGRLCDVYISKKEMRCSADKGPCDHMIFATVHPMFTER